MHRSLLPFILASLGSILFAWALNMPLFEWHISEIVSDAPFEAQFTPSPWVTKFGESLENSSYIIRQIDGRYCKNDRNPEELDSVVTRSRVERTLEKITQSINHSIIPWLWLLILLSGIHIWWHTIYYKRPITEALISTIVAVVLLYILLDISRPFFARVTGLGCLEDTITFNARLSKIHYETLIVMFASILAEVGALVMILRHIIKVVVERKSISK